MKSSGTRCACCNSGVETEGFVEFIYVTVGGRDTSLKDVGEKYMFYKLESISIVMRDECLAQARTWTSW